MIKINLNASAKIVKRLGLDEKGSATRFLRDDVDRLSDPYVPMSNDSGVHMKDNKTYPSDHEIEYRGPYAHYHHTGILMLAKNGSSWAKTGEKNVKISV